MFGWGVKSVTTTDLEERLKARKQIVIDVREPHEFATGRIKGSVNIPLRQLGDKLHRFNPAAEIYLICHSGSRSSRAARICAKAGFENAYSVKGGTRAWRGKFVR
jgi:rhodanese-related sulfurtransferase